jgi:hypothetical protein
MDEQSVRNMTSRSMPRPKPPVGGKPCSSLTVFRVCPDRTRQHSRIEEDLVDGLRLVVARLLLPRLLLEPVALVKRIVQLVQLKSTQPSRTKQRTSV